MGRLAFQNTKNLKNEKKRTLHKMIKCNEFGRISVGNLIINTFFFSFLFTK